MDKVESGIHAFLPSGFSEGFDHGFDAGRQSLEAEHDRFKAALQSAKDTLVAIRDANYRGLQHSSAIVARVAINDIENRIAQTEVVESEM